MAHDSPTEDHALESQSNAIDLLRSVAQEHLRKIDEERIQEQHDGLRKTQDLERYAKHKRPGKQGTTASSHDTPLPKMRTAQGQSSLNIASRNWDKDLDITEYVVGYLERFEGIKEMPAKNWISESTDEEWIPQHRIKYFKKICEGGDHDVVWDREARVDKIFGTGAGASRIDEDDKVDMVSEDGGVRLMP
ncbi:hypothetical protein G647_08878 [Cladophialophora carrionii CBS 160.54]|uniref:MJ1316 RNA cyclic group end recognition domain-containing protein n=1 Tax=Cladophialophora carrionii CBS 160.54 TaxID=1279043 RepID=V9CZ05_9EURO|nr:uncharacterized protein G647_08878 [Cladophialophora carrionii CBS 160.54]ETI19864.1 hypothetical protein G647_08878 [Cladophialophora carrionii CBS 160.54]